MPTPGQLTDELLVLGVTENHRNRLAACAREHFGIEIHPEHRQPALAQFLCELDLSTLGTEVPVALALSLFVLIGNPLPPQWR